MWTAIKEFVKQSADKILCISAVVFCFAAFCNLSYQGKNWAFSIERKPNWLLLALGIMFLILFWLSNRVSTQPKIRNKKIESGFEMKIDSRHHIRIVSGKIEDQLPSDYSAVVLPANTSFDDTCITDNRSALGSFFLRHFPSAISDIQREIIRQARQVCDAPDDVPLYAPVGTTLVLSKPLGSNYTVLVTAVTMIDEVAGITADTLSIIAAMKGVLRTASQHRISSLSLPVFGTGHGGLDFKAALSLLLVECLHSVVRGSNHHVTEVTIVVYDPNGERAEQIKSIVKAFENMASA